MRTPHGLMQGTDQEKAWAGEFGNDYNRRSPGNDEANYHFFKKALYKICDGLHTPRSIVELGAGQGANLRALHRLLPQAELAAVELNRKACEVLAHSTTCTSVINASVLDWQPGRTWDLAFTKGLLIHIAPEHLPTAYETLYRVARRWILVAEYFNPTPLEVHYRGKAGLLFKRDFAGELLGRYPDLRLVDYGFVYRRDAAPQDDLTWFLMEKCSENSGADPSNWRGCARSPLGGV